MIGQSLPMPALSFAIVRARAERHAAVPLLMLTIRIEAPAPLAPMIEGLALGCQLRIEPNGRRYTPPEEANLEDLFGATSRWRSTLRPLLWMESSLLVPSFCGATEIDLAVPCSYDLEVSANRYFHSLAGGEVPLRLLLRGTVFTRGERGLEVTPLPWDREASFRLPVTLWRELMDHYFPGAGWLRFKRETIDALLQFKGRRSLASWDGVIEALLAEARTP